MMREKIKIHEAVIVEGRYDKIKLSNIIDAFILETDGFSIFKDKKKLAFVKKLALERGIVVLTDSDHAGFMIRNHIAGAVPKQQIKNVYIPDVFGKEKRKAAPSKEGKIGVEGMSTEVILNAFEKAGVTASKVTCDNPVTTADFFELGLTGGANSKEKRKELCAELDLPEFLSVSSLISCINNMMSKEEFAEKVKAMRI
ncbi:DUF4093 domain-containing protein [uncultured Eubacterium sp.]|uniref:toprim domain-containing protein n=1 Tax=uncultured Eubacterium sp. TaxID=165185 RepID=UPI003459C694